MTPMIGRRLIEVAAILSGLIFAPLARAQQSTQFAGPSGNVTVPVTNDSASAVPLQNVSVVFKAGPSFFHVHQPTPASVDSVAVGAESDFVFPYTIDSGAPDGAYSATFTVVPAGTFASESPDGTFDTSVTFHGSRLRFLDENVV